LIWRGSPVTRPFQVVVSADGEPPATITGASVQTAVIPKSAPRVLAAIVALALLAAAAWFLLLKPAAQSAAKEAVNQPLAKVAQQADNAGKKADAAGQKADDAKNAVTGKGPAPNTTGAPPAVSPSGKPGDIAANSTSAPARIRLQTTVSAGPNATDSTYTVPAKTTLTITDLFLENPQGDAGRVDVLVDGNPILTLSLANFRDQDYHWVSPIEVPAGKTFSLRTTCQTPGKTLAGFTGNQCRVLLLASGLNWKTPPAP
jgi:hypothetical protein